MSTGMGRRMSREVSKVQIAGVATVLALVSISGCSGSDGGGGNDGDTPVGGINGPARVDADTGGATNDEPAD